MIGQWSDRLAAIADMFPACHNRAQNGGEPYGAAIVCLSRLIIRVGIKGGEGGNGGTQYVHRRGRSGQQAHYFEHTARQFAVGLQLSRYFFELRPGWQDTVPEQVGGLFKRGVTRQVVDIDTKVGEFPKFSV